MYISNNKTRKVVCVMIQLTESAQSFFLVYTDIILPENPARFIDAFVESIALQTLGFSVQIKGKGHEL
jgi:hypothetical protein